MCTCLLRVLCISCMYVCKHVRHRYGLGMSDIAMDIIFCHVAAHLMRPIMFVKVTCFDHRTQTSSERASIMMHSVLKHMCTYNIYLCAWHVYFHWPVFCVWFVWTSYDTIALENVGAGLLAMGAPGISRSSATQSPSCSLVLNNWAEVVVDGVGFPFGKLIWKLNINKFHR